MANIMNEALSISRAKKQLGKAYCGAIERGIPLRKIPSIMLWGPPGIGKSDGVKQLASDMADRTGKTVTVTDIRLMLFNPVDLRGIPTVDADRQFSVWLRPKLFDMDPSEDKVNILFLDELSAAPPSVQAAAYQIVLDRRVGEHVLPENCIVIAAGNRVTDKSVAYKMPKALANRLCHLDIEVDFDDWREWAVRSGIHPKIISFISFRRDCLFRFDSSNADTNAYPSPRSWEMVSNWIKYFSDDANEIFALLAGCVGVGAATELLSWFEVFSKIPSMEEILSGQHREVPETIDMIYAIISSLADSIKSAHNSENEIDNAISFGLLLPPEFTAMFFSDLLFLDKDIRGKLMKNTGFREWFLKQGREF